VRRALSPGNPTYLFDDPDVFKKLSRSGNVYFFLDYDGTLSPIADIPGHAVLSKEAKLAVGALSRCPGCEVAVVSGRALQDIAGRVGLKNIVYVGNHGFEIRLPRGGFRSPVTKRYRAILRRIKHTLKKALSPIRGALIEDKGISLCVHYRMVDKKDIPVIKSAFSASIRLNAAYKEVAVRRGKKVLEIRPPAAWDKGKAVEWLLRRKQLSLKGMPGRILAVYIGDDTTDEDAFSALRNRTALTVFVGKSKKTAAMHYLKNTSDVMRFLREAYKKRTASGHP